jgi:hypothetical protein
MAITSVDGSCERELEKGSSYSGLEGMKLSDTVDKSAGTDNRR